MRDRAKNHDACPEKAPKKLSQPPKTSSCHQNVLTDDCSRSIGSIGRGRAVMKGVEPTYSITLMFSSAIPASPDQKCNFPRVKTPRKKEKNSCFQTCAYPSLSHSSPKPSAVSPTPSDKKRGSEFSCRPDENINRAMRIQRPNSPIHRPLTAFVDHFMIYGANARSVSYCQLCSDEQKCLSAASKTRLPLKIIKKRQCLKKKKRICAEGFNRPLLRLSTLRTKSDSAGQERK